MLKINTGTIKMKMAKYLRPGLIALFIAIIGLSLFKIWDTNNNYIKEQRIREQMSEFAPSDSAPGTQVISEDGLPVIVNQSIIDAQAVNPDIVGWLTMDGTRIDYPFVQAQNNEYYLRRDINGDYSFAGTLFMDSRHDSAFTDYCTAIYGHNMENGTMFSDIRRYDNAEFFAANREGYLYLPYATYRLEVFAYMRVNGSDSYIYGAGTKDDFDRGRILKYIEETALRYRDLSLDVADRLLLLSTCTNTSNDARSVIIARLVQIAQPQDAIAAANENITDSYMSNYP